ncbi:MAG: hypothetical protein JO170_10500 [Verrucomicrobia bacterium]|nr:hypothetical protein [Verrucomicrobiota bacterium]
MARRPLTELSSEKNQAPVQPLAVVDRMSQSSSLPKKKARRRFARVVADLPQASLQLIASGAAAIIPISTFAMSHTELAGLEPTRESVLLHLPTILLILCGLAYSAPTVAEWAFLWTFSRAKAWAFTLLLEGVMTLSHVPVLPVICLCWLAGINLLVANVKSGKRKYKLAK